MLEARFQSVKATKPIVPHIQSSTERICFSLPKLPQAQIYLPSWSLFISITMTLFRASSSITWMTITAVPTGLQYGSSILHLHTNQPWYLLALASSASPHLYSLHLHNGMHASCEVLSSEISPVGSWQGMTSELD